MLTEFDRLVRVTLYNKHNTLKEMEIVLTDALTVFCAGCPGSILSIKY